MDFQFRVYNDSSLIQKWQQLLYNYKNIKTEHCWSITYFTLGVNSNGWGGGGRMPRYPEKTGSKMFIIFVEKPLITLVG